MKAIIVDDEPRAIDLLASYLTHFPSIQLVGTFRNALKVLDFLQQTPVELVFLDINMPHLSGISLSRLIHKNTKIIFTTAHAEYAVESYEVQAVDYLLKPITLERFTQAISRVLAKNEQSEEVYPEHKLLIKSGSKHFKVNVHDILYLAKDGNYMIYHLENQKIMARESVQEALSILPDFFVQIHKSYIVNLRHIQYYEKQEVCVGEQLLPLSITFKDQFLKIFYT